MIFHNYAYRIATIYHLWRFWCFRVSNFLNLSCVLKFKKWLSMHIEALIMLFHILVYLDVNLQAQVPTTKQKDFFFGRLISFNQNLHVFWNIFSNWMDLISFGNFCAILQSFRLISFEHIYNMDIFNVLDAYCFKPC